MEGAEDTVVETFMGTRKAEFRLTHMTAEELLACCDAAQASKRDS